jgi:hypothetical protein
MTTDGGGWTRFVSLYRDFPQATRDDMNDRVSQFNGHTELLFAANDNDNEYPSSADYAMRISHDTKITSIGGDTGDTCTSYTATKFRVDGSNSSGTVTTYVYNDTLANTYDEGVIGISDTDSCDNFHTNENDLLIGDIGQKDDYDGVTTDDGYDQSQYFSIWYR